MVRDTALRIQDSSFEKRNGGHAAMQLQAWDATLALRRLFGK
jgi:hypothetical protein